MAETQPAAEGAETDALDELEAALADDPTGAEGGEPEEWTAPTREEHAALLAAHQAEREADQAKLKRAREQAKRLREGKPAIPAKAEGGQPAPTDAAGGDVAVWQARAVRASAKAELINRGADPEMVDLVLARLKPGEVDFTDDDEPDLDEWLDDMQASYPKLFAPATPAPAAQPRRPGRVDQGATASGQPVLPQLSLGQQIIAKSEAARRAGSRSRI